MNEQFIDRVIKILIERTDLPEPTKANGNSKLRSRYRGAGSEMNRAGELAGSTQAALARSDYHKYRGRRHEQPPNPAGPSREERRKDAAKTYVKRLVSTGQQGSGLGNGHLKMYRPDAQRATIRNPQEAIQFIKDKIVEGKRSKALARATNPNKINKLKASQERGDSNRALKSGKGGEDALNRMFGIGKKGK